MNITVIIITSSLHEYKRSKNRDLPVYYLRCPSGNISLAAQVRVPLIKAGPTHRGMSISFFSGMAGKGNVITWCTKSICFSTLTLPSLEVFRSLLRLAFYGKT